MEVFFGETTSDVSLSISALSHFGISESVQRSWGSLNQIKQLISKEKEHLWFVKAGDSLLKKTAEILDGRQILPEMHASTDNKSSTENLC